MLIGGSNPEKLDKKADLINFIEDFDDFELKESILSKKNFAPSFQTFQNYA